MATGSTSGKNGMRWLKWNKFYKFAWIALLTGILAIAVFFVILSFQNLPTFEDLENPDYELASVLYYHDLTELGRYYRENRVPVNYDDLSPHLVNALVATEDERYHRHSGIDFRALMRVAVKTILLGQSGQGGGSTITQQLAKQLYPRQNTRGLNKIQRIWKLGIAKFKEWITAVKLEKSYTKEEIISMLLNKFEFLYQSFGIRAASENYFGKPQDQLEIQEAAVLIGMLKNPDYYNPKKFPENSEHRRNTVLAQMVKHKMLTRAEYDSLKLLPIDMSNFQQKNQSLGSAPYFRAYVTNWLKRLFEEENIVKPDGSKYDIYSDGLKIYTTLDPIVQTHAEVSMWEYMPENQERYFRVWENRDPWTYQGSDHEFSLAPRQQSLINRIRESERYILGRSAFLGELITRISEKYGYVLSDRDIEYLSREESQRGTLAGLQAQNVLSRDKVSAMRRLLTNEDWQVLKAQWDRFQKKIEQDFNTPVPMKVFDYSPQGERDTVMTPLDSIKYHRKHLQTGVLAIDPKTGYIKGWVGGINHRYFKFDHVTSSRQVGSTFKPFVYTTAIMRGISPCTKLKDQPYTIAPGDGEFYLAEAWTPSNSTGKYSGEWYTLYEGLQNSINTFSVYLMRELGSTEVVRDLARMMGIDVDTERSDGNFRVPSVPSICLGSADLTLLEMTGAYTTFANNGEFNSPIFVTRIEDKFGKVIYSQIARSQQALNPEVNYVMVDMLRRSAGYRPGITIDFGGKTGTTNNYVDGWFIGISPELVVGCWVGGEDPWIRFQTLAQGQGSVMAKPIVLKTFQRLEGESKEVFNTDATFVNPPGRLNITLDCDEYDRQQSPLEEVDQFDRFELEFDTISTNYQQQN